ncbi:MAG TPA: hypothetical protein VGP72_32055 [Planctomycetota bacterium]|jgi:hypothetical protein
MDNANYIRHLKVLGKLADLFDKAVAAETDLTDLLEVFVEQYATGTGSLSDVKKMPVYTNQWAGAITNGPTALRKVAIDAATAHLLDANFQDDLTTKPTNTSSVASVIAAFAIDMSGAKDNVTLTTKSAAGLVNFFDAIAGSSGTWNTAADGSATYKDSVYVVDTLVS